MSDGSLKLSAIKHSDRWRVELTWPNRLPRYFGWFDSQKQAEKWISDHRWLVENTSQSPTSVQPRN